MGEETVNSDKLLARKPSSVSTSALEPALEPALTSDSVPVLAQRPEPVSAPELFEKDILGDGFCGINSVASVLFAGLGVDCTADEDPLRVDLVGNAKFIADVKESLEGLIRVSAYSTLPDPSSISIQDYYSLKAYFQQPFFTEMQPKFEKQCVPLIFRIALLRIITSPRPVLFGCQQSLNYAARLERMAQGESVSSLESLTTSPAMKEALQEMLFAVNLALLGSNQPATATLQHEAEKKFQELGDCDVQESVLVELWKILEPQREGLTQSETIDWVHSQRLGVPFKRFRSSGSVGSVGSVMLETLVGCEALCTDAQGNPVDIGSFAGLSLSEQDLDSLLSIAIDIENEGENRQTERSLAHFKQLVVRFDRSAQTARTLPLAGLDHRLWPSIDQLSVLVRSLFKDNGGELVIVGDRPGYVLNPANVLRDHSYARVLIRNQSGGHFDLIICERSGMETDVKKQFESCLKRNSEELKKGISQGAKKGAAKAMSVPFSDNDDDMGFVAGLLLFGAIIAGAYAAFLILSVLVVMVWAAITAMAIAISAFFVQGATSVMAYASSFTATSVAAAPVVAPVAAASVSSSIATPVATTGVVAAAALCLSKNKPK